MSKNKEKQKKMKILLTLIYEYGIIRFVSAQKP